MAAIRLGACRTTTRRVALLFALLGVVLGGGFGPPLTRVESEPNNTPATANSVAIGDTVSGVVNPDLDRDYFALDVASGDGVMIELLHNSEVGVFLLNSTGDTVWTRGGFYDNARLRFRAPATARYYVATAGFASHGGPQLTYTVSFDTVAFTEVEPNDLPPQAQPFTLGDTTQSGIVLSGDDRDLYRVNFDSGTIVELEVLSEGYNDYGLLWTVDLLSSDGNDTLLQGQVGGGPFRYFVAETADYLVRVGGWYGYGPASFYSLRVNTIAGGPGDPVRVLSSGLGQVDGIAAAPNGDLFVAGWNGVLRVTQDGDTTRWTTIHDPAIAVDAFGNLLVMSPNRLFRFVAPGDSVLVAQFDYVPADVPLAIASNGDIMVAAVSNYRDLVFRLDPFGRLIDSTLADQHDDLDKLVFSVSGQLQFVDQQYPWDLRELADGSSFHVTPLPWKSWVAYDQDGYLYYANESGLRLKTPDYQEVSMPLVVGAQLTAITFGRTPEGATARMFAASPMHGGSVLEINPAGIRAPGHFVGVEAIDITPDLLPPAALGFAYLVALSHSSNREVVWSVFSGEPPPGMQVSPSGTISGRPEETGVFEFGVVVTGAGGFGFREFSVSVTEPLVDIEVVRNQILRGENALNADERAFLDTNGNKNGRVDLGDLRALYQNHGLIGTRPVNATETRSQEQP